MTKKVVLQLSVHDEKEKQKAMKAVSGLSGIESLAMDMKDKKLTVLGDVDPIEIVSKLRKSWQTQILTVGPAKEPEKKPGGDQKKDDKKEEKKDDSKKGEAKSDPVEELVKLYKNYNPSYTQYYHVYSAEENPNSCVIS